MSRAYFQSSVETFISTDELLILGSLTRAHHHALDQLQRDAWMWEIRHLQAALSPTLDGHILFEFSIPRMGKRADVVLFLQGLILVLEYKVGDTTHSESAKEQALDYALDLKNFHEGSHDLPIVPIAIATSAEYRDISLTWYEDGLGRPISIAPKQIESVLHECQTQTQPPETRFENWLNSPYKPTPTIVEASQALYRGHDVKEISRSDATTQNLSTTTDAISRVIELSKAEKRKSICFVTGVPGSGKTLAGLNIANERRNIDENEYAVFLSGNLPLVSVLQEALARDEVERTRIKKTLALQNAKALIQAVHNFRDECIESTGPPIEKVVIFDEAQRAWNVDQTRKFMEQKRGVPNFNQSEPELLLSALDRHTDWCVMICLVGGGQEINTGEAGLIEWFDALCGHFTDWQVFFSDRISGNEYNWGRDLVDEIKSERSTAIGDLHLGVSVRSYRSEKVSSFVSAIIDSDSQQAGLLLPELERYPIVLTRDIQIAKDWLIEQSRGSERFGLIASSNAIRLKPEGIYVKNNIDPRNWFLNDKFDVRSSYYLEDVASEFEVQGLELDWVGVCWDGNLCHDGNKWSTYQFSGTTWKTVQHEYRKRYLFNAYRVLLTRARQGLVIFVPRGDATDQTRLPSFYDGTYEFLKATGIKEILKHDG